MSWFRKRIECVLYRVCSLSRRGARYELACPKRRTQEIPSLDGCERELVSVRARSKQRVVMENAQMLSHLKALFRSVANATGILRTHVSICGRHMCSL